MSNLKTQVSLYSRFSILRYFSDPYSSLVAADGNGILVETSLDFVVFLNFVVKKLHYKIENRLYFNRLPRPHGGKFCNRVFFFLSCLKINTCYGFRLVKEELGQQICLPLKVADSFYDRDTKISCLVRFRDSIIGHAKSSSYS